MEDGKMCGYTSSSWGRKRMGEDFKLLGEIIRVVGGGEIVNETKDSIKEFECVSYRFDLNENSFDTLKTFINKYEITYLYSAKIEINDGLSDKPHLIIKGVFYNT